MVMVLLQMPYTAYYYCIIFDKNIVMRAGREQLQNIKGSQDQKRLQKIRYLERRRNSYLIHTILRSIFTVL